ncbi:MAG: type II toxin-antitoxin system Phd/YefM family antitoxin [Candidatus Saccharimonadales bacterium]
MKTVSIHDAKTNLSKYIAAAKRGESIAIGAYGKPDVMLKVLASNQKQTPVRQLGTLEAKVRSGKIYLSPDAFSEKLDKEIYESIHLDD